MVTVMDAVALRGSGDKGSIGNRVDFAAANMKNDATSYLKAAGVLGTVCAGAAAVKANPKAFKEGANKTVRFARKGLLTIAKKLPRTGKARACLANISNAIGRNSTVTALIALGTLAVGALHCINTRHAFKAGQIDQKYTDRAAVAADIK